MEFIIGLDLLILEKINNWEPRSLWDPCMRLLSGKEIWMMFPPLFLFYAIAAKRWQALKIFGLMLVSVALADAIAAWGMKPFFARYRPCQEWGWVRAIAGCAGAYGFPSNHSANSMAIAVMAVLRGPRWLGRLFVAVALLIGLSRIYLGAHYLTDVLVGFALGAIVAFSVHKSAAFLTRRRYDANN